jgi:vacuolar-type H+-ATPase subunit H
LLSEGLGILTRRGYDGESKIQNPKSKIIRGGESKIQNPKSKIIRGGESKIQNLKSKIPTEAILGRDGS